MDVKAGTTFIGPHVKPLFHFMLLSEAELQEFTKMLMRKLYTNCIVLQQS